MPDDEFASSVLIRRTPWNKGKLTGAKPPLRPKHVWSIRTRLLVEGRTRDLARRDHPMSVPGTTPISDASSPLLNS
jgi:hypothetical protein